MGGEGGRWECGKVGSEWEGYGNGQVRFDRFDRRSDSMPVFAVGWLVGHVQESFDRDPPEKVATFWGTLKGHPAYFGKP